MSAAERWRRRFAEAAEARADAGLLRVRAPVEPMTPPAAVRGVVAGRDVTLFSTNDYLGLSAHPAVVAAARDALGRHGLGPRGSTLICGHTTLHAALEARIAALEGCEAAVLTPTGFAANAGLLAALAGPDVTIVSDALNHASIIDGCRLAARAGARLAVVPHADLAGFERALDGSPAGHRKVVVTDGVFSMDGDMAPLGGADGLVALAAAHDALLVVDEAHATLAWGPGGAGALATAAADSATPLDAAAAVRVGTLSKAVGALGGFVAGDAALCSWFVNHARPQIYSTALPVPVVTAATAALEVAGRERALQATLWRRVAALGAQLDVPLASPIVPWRLPAGCSAVEVAAQLLQRDGLHVGAIRPPTVPAGTERLRVALSAAHSEDDIKRLAAALLRVGGSVLDAAQGEAATVQLRSGGTSPATP
jgi:8-amino-7-oxononanoate synthase